MKYIFIGDIHGKVDAVEKALSKEGKKIFVGDFIDSFNKTPGQHGQCFRLVLDAIKAGEAEAIYGNHELSYLYQHHRCSGYSLDRAQIMWAYEAEIKEHFKPYILLKHNLLISHAGLSEHIWVEENLTFGSLPQALAEWWPNMGSPMHRIGRARGGMHKVGGMFWCDFNDEFEPITGLNQIFGHTRGQGIRRIGGEAESSWCIDGLDKSLEFLEMEIEE